MAHTFDLNPEALKRQFAVYVVIATDGSTYDLYVGKTGDNREGCNPLISRCGNHFSYNKIHSQIRNKLSDHESKQYTYVFDHFGGYVECAEARRPLIDMINEMERCLNQQIVTLVRDLDSCILHNSYKGSWLSKAEKEKRATHRTRENMAKLEQIVDRVKEIIVDNAFRRING
jgi:hypothetical protein